MAAAGDDQGLVAALTVMADEFSFKADEIDPSLGPNGEAAVDRSRAASRQ
jgi:hypothetical protein